MKNRRNIIESELPPQNHLDIWMKDGKFYRSTNKGWVLIEDQMEFTNSELMSKSTATSGTIGVNKETGEASIYNDVTKEWSPLGGGMTETTWQELKDKRDNGKLTPGSLYRITDYQCTTTQENTQSAGHQFDIVLLALSEDKLAEEGWAMMHDNIYDVTFADGVTKKCYLYGENVNSLNIVDCNTLLGTSEVGKGELVINEDNKTITTHNYHSSDLNEENLPYNYFQNSNLSAWKVWYCLDNDKSRFAWAATPSSAAYSLTINLGGYEIACTTARDKSRDSGEFKCFIFNMTGSETLGWIKSETISVGTVTVYLQPSEDGPTTELTITSVTELPPVKATGVIYRLIDEWGNDVGYDFKNIQFLVENNWIYTMSNYGLPGDEIDVSVSNNGFVVNNYISKQINVAEGGEILGGNTIVSVGGCSVIGLNSKNNIVEGENITLINCSDTRTIQSNSILISCGNLTPEESGFYFGNKKVLTES